MTQSIDINKYESFVDLMLKEYSYRHLSVWNSDFDIVKYDNSSFEEFITKGIKINSDKNSHGEN